MRTWFVALLLAFALARFGQVAYRGLTYSIGDFYSTLPGAYVESLNPTLWASTDLTDTVGRASYYRRGPTQFLTSYPLSFLDSYREIALVLLGVYAIVIIASAAVMWRALSRGRDWRLLCLVISSTLLFYPTLQAYIAREFEILIMAGIALMFAATLQGRLATAGAWTAYISLYKFLPLALLPLFVIRRWWRSLAGFSATAIVILILAHALFGLQNFSSDGFVQGFASGIITTLGSSKDFCDGPFQFLRYSPASHDVSVRFALCGIQQHVDYPVPAVYLLLLTLTLIGLAIGFFRAERAALSAEQERWRRTWELSAVVIVFTTFFFTHYYYLTMLMAPVTAVLVRAYQDRRKGLWIAWGASYLLLSAFLLPLSAVSRWLETDAWMFYLSTFAYLPGELLLLGIVIYEYLHLSGSKSSSDSIGSTG